MASYTYISFSRINKSVLLVIVEQTAERRSLPSRPVSRADRTEIGLRRRITSGLNIQLHSISKLFISQVIIPQVICLLFVFWFFFVCLFFYMFIFRGHSTQEPASSKVTYFILRAYTETMRHPQLTLEKLGRGFGKMQVNGPEG